MSAHIRTMPAGLRLDWIARGRARRVADAQRGAGNA